MGWGGSHFGVGGVTFWGVKGERSQLCPSQLCTRVMPPDANPAWNEVFFFPLRVRCPPKIPHPFPKVGAPPKWGGHPHFNTLPFLFASPQLPPICDEIQLAILSGYMDTPPKRFGDTSIFGDPPIFGGDPPSFPYPT